jgi:hypothetical protein
LQSIYIDILVKDIQENLHSGQIERKLTVDRYLSKWDSIISFVFPLE